MIIIRENYNLEATHDPWGAPLAAYDVLDEVDVVVTDETVPYNNGYHTIEATVYKTQNGERCYSIPPMDYGGGTRYRWLDGDREGLLYTRPNSARRYCLAGLPVQWDAEYRGWHYL